MSAPLHFWEISVLFYRYFRFNWRLSRLNCTTLKPIYGFWANGVPHKGFHKGKFGKRWYCGIFFTPCLVVSATIQISRVLFIQALDRRSQFLPLAKMPARVEQTGNRLTTNSGLNQVITKSCSFEGELGRAQEFLLTPLQVLLFSIPLHPIWKCVQNPWCYPFLTAQQSEVQPWTGEH